MAYGSEYGAEPAGVGYGDPYASPGAQPGAGFGGAGGYGMESHGGGMPGQYGLEHGMAPPRPQIMDVAGNPLEESKALQISRLRAMVDDMGAIVDITKRKLDDAHHASGGDGMEGGMGAGGPAAGGMHMGGDGAGPAGAYRNLEVDPSALAISEGMLHMKQQRSMFNIGKRWQVVPVRIDEHGRLLVFNRAASDEPTTTIQLGSGVTFRSEEPDAHTAPEAANAFVITGPSGETVLLSSETEEERDLWRQAVEQVAAMQEEVIEHNNRVSQAVSGADGGAGGGFGASAGSHAPGMFGMGMAGADGMAGDSETKMAEEAEAERQEEAKEEVAMRHVAYGPGITHGARGEQTEFVIELQDEAGKPDARNFNVRAVEAVLDSDELGMQLQLRVEDMGDGRGVCYYTPPQTGEYNLNLTVNGKPIYGSPFEIDVDAAPTAPGKCQVEGDGTITARVGAENVFTIVAFDQFGEQRSEGGDRWSIDVVGPATEPIWVDNNDGTYDVKYEVDLDHEDIRSGGRRLPSLEFSVFLLDPRFERLSQNGNPYRRPLKNMPISPTVILESAGGALTADQLASIAPALTPGRAATAGTPLTASALSTSRAAPTSSMPLGPSATGAGAAASSVATPASAASAAAAAAAASGQAPPPPPSAAPSATAVTALKARLAEAEAELEAARRDAHQLLADKEHAEEALADMEARKAQAEAEAVAAVARATAAEERAETAEASASRAAGSSEQTQRILTQLTEQSTRLESFAKELNEKQRALDERERALNAEAEALAAGDRATASAMRGVAMAAGQASIAADGSVDASLMEQAQLAAGAGDTTISSLGGGRGVGPGAAATPGSASASFVPGNAPGTGTGTGTGAPPVAGGGPASLASGTAMSLDTAAMLRSAYTGAPGAATGAASSSDPQAGPSADLGLSDSAPAELFAEDAMAIIEAHRPVLHAVLQHYSKGAGRISSSQFVRIMKDYDIIDTFTNSAETKSVFAATAEANNISADDDGKIRLGFSAFIEALGRMALVTLSKPTFAGLYPTAHEKLGVMLDVWSLGSQERLEEVKAAAKERKGRKKAKASA